MNNFCPLCNSVATVFYKNNDRLYHQCTHCLGIFMDQTLRYDKENEKSRYLNHNNDVDDEGYQQFVSPITLAVMRDFSPEHQGLDFGAGTGPVISKILKDNQFNIRPYDPFFYNYPQLLAESYDFIVCCEVMEHFYNPTKEFSLLKSLLNEGGRLYCMTEIYSEDIDFPTWYYKADTTHVFFYHRQSLQYIKEQCSFSALLIEDRLITFSK